MKVLLQHHFVSNIFFFTVINNKLVPTHSEGFILVMAFQELYRE